MHSFVSSVLNIVLIVLKHQLSHKKFLLENVFSHEVVKKNALYSTFQIFR